MVRAGGFLSVLVFFSPFLWTDFPLVIIFLFCLPSNSKLLVFLLTTFLYQKADFDFLHVYGKNRVFSVSQHSLVCALLDFFIERCLPPPWP